MFFGGSKNTVQYIVAGLGNPGLNYEMTRHNIGFRALDYIAGKTSCDVKKLKHYALTGRCIIGGKGVMLMKPQTYMNNSGQAISDAAHFYKIPDDKIIVIHDDTALPVGALRIRKSGSAGGHNGIKSVIEHLGSQDFIHIRLGIGQKPAGYDLADYVLGKFSPSDFNEISANFDNIFSAVELIINENTDKAMNLYNKNIKVNKDE